MSPRQELRHTTSGFCSLTRFLRSALVLAPFALYTLTIIATTAAQTTARSDAGADHDASPYYASNEHRDPRTHTVFANVARSLDAVSVLVLRYSSSPVVHRRAHESHISGQALTAIILIATITFCVLVGCLMQLPAALIFLRNRISRSRRAAAAAAATTGSRSSLFDVEMGDQEDPPVPLACDAPSPPPPYSRAPSYESSRENSVAGGRDERIS